MNIFDLIGLNLGGQETQVQGQSPAIPGLGQLNNSGIPHAGNAGGLGGNKPLSTAEKFDFGLQGANSLLQGFLGLEQLGLAKDQYNFQRDAFNKNYDANRRTTNARLADRQATRNIDNPNSTPVQEYMKRYGIQ